MSGDRPDVVFYCDSGHERRLVQRMRFMATQGVWTGVVNRAAEQQITREDLTADDPRLPGLPMPVRGRYPLTCSCGENVPVRAERLRFFLDGPGTLELTEVPLAFLRRWLELAPRSHSMPGGYGH